MAGHHAILGQKGRVRIVVGTPATINTDTDDYSFNSVSFGTEAADRIVGCAIGTRANASRSLLSVSVGGTAADWFDYANSTASGADMTGLALRRIPTGSSGTIRTVFSAAMLRCGIIPFVVYGAQGGSIATPFDSDKSTSFPVASVTTSQRVGGIVIGASYVAGNDHTPTWGGLTSGSATVDIETTGGELNLAYLLSNSISAVTASMTVSGGLAVRQALQTVALFA